MDILQIMKRECKLDPSKISYKEENCNGKYNNPQDKSIMIDLIKHKCSLEAKKKRYSTRTRFK